jgi:hypothetical protein
LNGGERNGLLVEMPLDALGEVPGRNDDVTNTLAREVAHDPLQEGTARNRRHRLWDARKEMLDAGAKAPRQDDGRCLIQERERLGCFGRHLHTFE